MVRIGRIGMSFCGHVGPTAKSTKKACSAQISSLVRAVQEGRAHIMATSFGFHVHIGDRAKMQPGVASIQINNLAVSGDGIINANDNVIVMNDVEIPTDLELLREAHAFVQESV